MHQVCVVPHPSEIWFNRNFSLIRSPLLDKLVVLTHHSITAAFSSFLLVTLLPPTEALLQGSPSSAGRCHGRSSPSRRCWTFSEGQRLNAPCETVLHRDTVSWGRSRALQRSAKISVVKQKGGCSFSPQDDAQSASLTSAELLTDNPQQCLPQTWSLTVALIYPADIITGKGDGGESIYGPTFEGMFPQLSYCMNGKFPQKSSC